MRLTNALPLWHYKARVYYPNIGRFLQTDPIGYEDSLNLYQYVGNDPVNLSDPSGRSIYIGACGNVPCLQADPQTAPQQRAAAPEINRSPPTPERAIPPPANDNAPRIPLGGLIKGVIARVAPRVGGALAILATPGELAPPERDEIWCRGYHYTTPENAMNIRQSGVIRANERGYSYFSTVAIPVDEVNNVVFIGRKPDATYVVETFFYNATVPTERDDSSLGGRRFTGSMYQGRYVRFGYVGPNVY